MKKVNRGFTLVETMVVLGISSFILAAMYGTLTTGRRSWLTGEALLMGQQEARIGLDKMVRELHLASTATVRADNRAVRFSIPFDADGDGFLDLVTGTSTLAYGADDSTDADADGALWEKDWSIEYVIDTDNNQISRWVLDAAGTQVSERLIASYINPDSTLTFFQTQAGGTGFTIDGVIINLTTQINAVQGIALSPGPQITLRAQVNLRN